MAYTPYPYYGGYSPTQPFVPRMDTQYPQPAISASQQPQQPAQGLSPSSRPVTSREEAMGVPADFNGSLMVFPDISHNRVFLKRWNFQTGAADFLEFEPARQERQEPSVAFAPLQDFLDMKDTIEKLRAEIDQLKKPAAKGGRKNDADE